MVYDASPIFWMVICIDSLGEPQLFSTLNANSASLQVQISEGDNN